MDDISDSLMASAENNEDRAMRIAFIAVGAAEIAVQRIELFDPEDVGNVYTAVTRFRALAVTIRDRTNSVFFNTDLYHVERVLITAAAGRTREFVMRVLVPGIDAENAARAAAALGIADAVKRDIEVALEAMAAGELTRDEAWTAIVERLDGLLSQLSAPRIEGAILEPAS